MIFRRFYDEKLAQASYLIGCAATGEGLVVDPNRDVEQYVRAAEAEGVRVTHVTETHIHADFVSGSRELAGRTGVALYLSDEGGEGWRYVYAEEAGAVLLKDGDSFTVGNIKIDVLHTPGHTPEHLTFLVTDTAGADGPMGAVTGDFLFVGDVGRPDLLEKAAGVRGSTDEAARELFRSLKKLGELPDHLQIWPGHGAGSACGKGMSSVPQSTLGYERLYNWAFSVGDEYGFVRDVLARQPEPPKYFAEMKKINKEGPRAVGDAGCPPRRLPETSLAGLLEEGAVVVDTRHAADYAEGHVPGTINVPLGRSFNTWAGWLVPYERDFYLIIDDSCSACVEGAPKDLAAVGLDRLAGYFGVGAVSAWAAGGRELESVAQIAPRELAGRLDAGEEVAVLDVRGAAEWEAGHLPGSKNVPVGHLADRLDEVPRDRPVVVHCLSGARSAIAASILEAHGFDNVANLAGGYSGWRAATRRIGTWGAPSPSRLGEPRASRSGATRTGGGAARPRAVGRGGRSRYGRRVIRTVAFQRNEEEMMSRPSNEPSFTRLDPGEALGRVRLGEAVIVDVREDEERAAGRIPGS